MITITVPGYKTFQFRHLVLDVNGTLAKDGQLIQNVPDLLDQLRSELEIHLVTADTHGKQESINRALSLEAVKIPQEDQVGAKLDYVKKLGAETVVAIGNGANDAAMLEGAALGICVIGPEGASTASLIMADIAAPDITAALSLLLNPKRMMATLRR